jgi:hypothetical protein
VEIENVLLAEAAVADIRGAMTLVGYNQRVVNSPNLPFSFKQTLIITLRGEVETGSHAQLSVNLTSPEGDSAFAFAQQVPIPPPASKGVPSFINIAMDIPFSGNSYGTYSLKVTWREMGQESQGRDIDIFVLDPAAATPAAG